MFPSGELIKQKRIQKGLSLSQLSQPVGISKSYLSNIEKGISDNVSESILRKISDYLGILQVTETVTETPVETRIAKLRADIECRSVSYQDAIVEAVQLLDLHKGTVGISKLGQIHLMLANLYRLTFQYTNTIRHATISQDIFSRSQDLLSWVQSTYEIAAVNYETSNYQPALEYLFLIEERLHEINYAGFWLAQTQTSIALNAAATGNTALMQEYIDRVDSTLESVTADDQGLLLANRDYLLARTLLDAKAYHDAADAYNSACYRYRSVNRPVSALRMRHNIAESYFLSGSLWEAKTIAIEVLRQKKAINVPASSLARTELLLAEISLGLEDYDGADKYCKRVIKNDAVDVGGKARCLQVMARMARAKNDLARFNKNMAEAMRLIKGKITYQALAIQLMTEYAETNHLDFV